MQLSVTKSFTSALTFSLRHAAPFYLLGLVVGLPAYLHSFLPRQRLAVDLPGGTYEDVLPRPWWETELAVPAIEAMLAGIMVAIMVHTLQRDRRGKVWTVWPSFAAAAPRLPTIFGVSVALNLAIPLAFAVVPFLGIGAHLIVVPLSVLGVFLYLIFCVAIPCAAVDNAGIIHCFERSAELTSGSRGRLLGVLILSMLPVLAIVGVMIVAAGRGVTVDSIPAFAIWLVGAAANVYFCALVVVIHEALVTLKEGAGAGTLATVFD